MFPFLMVSPSLQYEGEMLMADIVKVGSSGLASSRSPLTVSSELQRLSHLHCDPGGEDGNEVLPRRQDEE